MSISNILRVVCGLGVLLGSSSMLSAPPANAQQAACVHLLVGAGYAAKMSVNGTESASFEIGKTACQPLNNIPDGDTVTVYVLPLAGQKSLCTNPITRDAKSEASVTYLANGTTLDAKCWMPEAPKGK